MSEFNQVIGLIPAAGRGKRVAPLPGSKELFPVGFTKTMIGGEMRRVPKLISSYLLDRLRTAGVRRAYIVLSEDKTDILRYYGSGSQFGICLSYLVADKLVGMPYTLSMAYPWTKDATICFGMPDTIFYPEDSFTRLLSAQAASGADLTLGLYPVSEPPRFGMVSVNDEDDVTAVIDKPFHTDFKYAWGSAVWGPAFTEFLHEQVSGWTDEQDSEHEIVLSTYFGLALGVGLKVRAVTFTGGEYLDIGSPHDLELAVQRFTAG